jgi:hypothetical protein
MENLQFPLSKFLILETLHPSCHSCLPSLRFPSVCTLASSFLFHMPRKDRQISFSVLSMGVWQGVAMDSLKFHPVPPYPTLYPLQAGHDSDGLTAVSGVARPQGGRLAAISYPIGHPTPYAYGPWGCFCLHLTHSVFPRMRTQQR